MTSLNIMDDYIKLIDRDSIYRRTTLSQSFSELMQYLRYSSKDSPCSDYDETLKKKEHVLFVVRADDEFVDTDSWEGGVK